MTDDDQELQQQEHTYERTYEGGLAHCICCKEPLSANKSVFGVSQFYPFLPPDHFCEDCAKWLNVTPMEIP